jgi:hypothetical protein
MKRTESCTDFAGFGASLMMVEQRFQKVISSRSRHWGLFMLSNSLDVDLSGVCFGGPLSCDGKANCVKGVTRGDCQLDGWIFDDRRVKACDVKNAFSLGERLPPAGDWGHRHCHARQLSKKRESCQAFPRRTVLQLCLVAFRCLTSDSMVSLARSLARVKVNIRGARPPARSPDAAAVPPPPARKEITISRLRECDQTHGAFKFGIASSLPPRHVTTERSGRTPPAIDSSEASQHLRRNGVSSKGCSEEPGATDYPA